MTPTQHVGLIIVGLGLTFMLTGCGQPIKTYPYSWGAIHKSSQHVINEQCGSVWNSRYWDDGSLIKRGQDFGGCASHDDPNYCVVWVVSADVIPHELAHCDGVADPDEQYEWP